MILDIVRGSGLSAWLVALTEFLGGAALLAGVLTRWAAVPLSFTMVVAILAVHLKGGFFAPAGVEYPLTLLTANVALILTGPGALAVDGLLFAPRRPMAVERLEQVELARGA